MRRFLAHALALAAVPVLALPATASAVEVGIVPGQRAPLDSRNADEHKAAKDLGVKWARLFVDWSTLEPQQGHFAEGALEDFDRRIKGYADAGVKVLITAVRSPAWAAKDPYATGVQPPADPRTYADLLSVLATRWKGQVSAYEIWNEPDLAKWWAPAPNAAEYVALLKAASAAVKAHDPAAQVVSGGLAGGNVTFLAQMYDAGMTGEDIDGIGTHMSTACRVDMPGVYYREPDGRIGQYAFTGYRELHQESLERGAGESIWMTELGVSTLTDMCAEGSGAGSRPAGVSPAQQAQFLREAYSCLAADGYVGPAMWFSLQDVDENRSRYDHWMGLFDNAGAEKPSAGAMRGLAGGITPNPACGGRVDTVAPRVSIAAAPVFDSKLTIALNATDAETAVGRMYLTIRKASDPPEAQTQIPGGGLGGSYSLDWDGAKTLPLDVPHVITGYAYDEAKNLGGASVTVVRSVTAVKVATSAEIDARAKRGRRAVFSGTFTYTVPAGSALRGRGRLYVEYFKPADKRKRNSRAEWITTSRFTLLQSALRRAKVIDRATGKRRATFQKAARLPGDAKKWRARFEFEGLDPYQDSRAMTQFKAKG